MQDLEEWLTRPGGMAVRMRELRSRAELTGRGLARALEWSPSKVSRIEAGKQLASAQDVDAWADATKASEQERADLHRLREDAQVQHLEVRYRLQRGMPAVQGDYAQMAAESALVRVVTPTIIPGLLQIPAYTEALMRELSDLGYPGVDDRGAAVAARLERQGILYDPARRFDFLIGEAALRWLPVHAAVMRAQFDRLHVVSSLDNVRVGIIPFGRVLRVTPFDTFDVYVDAEGVAVVAVERSYGESFYRGEQAEAYNQLTDRLWEEAATGTDARSLILEAVRDLPDS